MTTMLLIGKTVRIIRLAVLWCAATILMVACAASALPPAPSPSCNYDGASDRDALEALYDSTAGTYWATITNWLSDEPFGSWYGVTTDENGRVTELDLSSNYLIGALPPEMCSLSKLEFLELRGNELSGEIPRSLAASPTWNS